MPFDLHGLPRLETKRWEMKLTVSWSGRRGDGFEFLHLSPVSRRRRQDGDLVSRTILFVGGIDTET
jgi:hypothetical protein